MVLIKKITDAYADVEMTDGRELHVAATPAALNLLSALAKTAPLEKYFSIYAKVDKACAASREKEAIFRLGQLDMQASVCDMLETLAKQYEDASSYSYAFLKAAAMVRSMEVPNANS